MLRFVIALLLAPVVSLAVDATTLLTTLAPQRGYSAALQSLASYPDLTHAWVGDDLRSGQGAGIEQWKAAIGTNYLATQATSGNRPTINTAVTPSGKNSAFFDGATGKQLVFSAADVYDKGCTFYTVVRATGAATNFGGIVGMSTGGASSNQVYLARNGTSAQLIAYLTSSTHLSDASTITQDQWAIYTVRYTNGRITKFRKNGLSAGVSVGGNQMLSAARTGEIGNITWGNLGWRGDIAAVLIYDNAHTDREMAAVEDILSEWSGIEVAHDSALTSISNYYLPSFTHKESPTGRLRVLTSADAVYWDEVPGVEFTPSSVDSPPQAGDYSVFQHTDGKWYMAYTRTRDVDQVTTSFGVSQSTDGLHWTNLADVDCTAISGVARVWAPEWFVDPADGAVHVTFSAGDAIPNNFYMSIYYVTLSGTDLSSRTTPVALAIPNQPRCIDSFVVKRGTDYFLWYRDNDSPYYIQVAKAAAFAGPYSEHRNGDWMGVAGSLEGVTLIDIGGTDRIYVDRWGIDGGLAYSDQTAGDWTGVDSTTWSALLPANTAIATPRHGTIIEVTP